MCSRLIRLHSGSLITALAAAALLLSACGPVPKPYKTDTETKVANPLVTIPDGRGIRIGTIAGGGDAFREAIESALVRALADSGIPATRTDALTRGLRLDGQADHSGEHARINWTLTRPDGTNLGSISVAERADISAYRNADPALVGALAQRGAFLVSRLLDPAGPVEAYEAPGDPVVAIVGVEGAPGDGNAALERAMRTTLAEAGIATGKKADATMLLAGFVAVEETDDPEEERVTIQWRILSPDGEEVGTLKQSNIIPKGSLNEVWGGTAYDAALANIEAVQRALDYMERVRDLQREAAARR